jgi:hypothetical protein
MAPDSPSGAPGTFPAPSPLTGDEPFSQLDATVRDFWRYAMPDLRMNTVRGHLAEFLVARAVAATHARIEWDAYDVKTPAGITIEVKTAGYLQSWTQTRLSAISFSGLQSTPWYAETNATGPYGFHADVYVFAVHTTIDHDTYDSLDLGAWELYVLSRTTVEALGQKSMGLSTVRRLAGDPVELTALDQAVTVSARENATGPVT